MEQSILLAGYILDLIFGDPRWFPHPVKGIGYLAKKLEPIIRRLLSNEYVGGTIFTLTIIVSMWTLTWLVIRICNSISIYFEFFISVFIFYTTLSIKDLKIESMEVYKALEKNDLLLARKKLSMIVGRDTGNLNKDEIIRATVETIAESTVDGIISPIFYAFIGGVPLALTYKAVNTLDSMIGYKNEKYREFGWCTAKVDDIVNFIPGIISGILIPVAGFFTGKNIINSIQIIFRDGIKNLVSGISESAVAGALQVQLGGINFYNSVPVSKPLLGDKVNLLEEKHIKETINIAYISSFLTLISSLLLWKIIS